MLGQVKEARDKGLKAPVLLMGWSSCLTDAKMCTQPCSIGYYNPVLAYGEQKAIQDASEAGANGFIMVDLPPEEATTFRDKCTAAGYINLPLCYAARVLIAPQSFLRPFDCTINDSPEDQVLKFNCRQFHLCCFQGPH